LTALLPAGLIRQAAEFGMKIIVAAIAAPTLAAIALLASPAPAKAQWVEACRHHLATSTSSSGPARDAMLAHYRACVKEEKKKKKR
jgi:hypothetical protein